MSVTEFELPNELQGVTFESILADMLGEVPNKYDKIEGGFVYDMIAPSALEAAELIQFWLALGLKMNFHMWATGKWLDFHAADCGLERRASTPAYGELKIVTTKAVTFPAGFVFSVPSENGAAAIDFETIEATTINGEGTIQVRAVLGGKSGNVAADTITIMKTPLNNVSSITNLEAFIGGTEAESDDSLRQRIDDFYAGRSSSFVGNCADYRRWALSVAGVGYVHVVPTPNNQPNTVKIVLADANGDPANTAICAAVEKKIFGTGHSDLNRLAPIGVASYSVEPFTLKAINISIEATYEESEAAVKLLIKNALKEYFKTLADDELNYGVLKYVQVSAVLSRVGELHDFKHLRINGGLDNITFSQTELPSVGTITFT